MNCLLSLVVFDDLLSFPHALVSSLWSADPFLASLQRRARIVCHVHYVRVMEADLLSRKAQLAHVKTVVRSPPLAQDGLSSPPHPQDSPENENFTAEEIESMKNNHFEVLPPAFLLQRYTTRFFFIFPSSHAHSLRSTWMSGSLALAHPKR